MSSDFASSRFRHPAWTIVILSLAPAIGLGICRFGYALVLPDMRDSLGWSYSTAGFMNTINAAGYLAGALGASAMIRRFGMFNTLWLGAAACVVSLIVSALSGDFVVFSAARLLSGIAAALAFVAGGALATTIGQAQPTNSAFYISLFYIGPALGLLVSGLTAPFLLEISGPGSWWVVWAVLAVVSGVLTLLLPLARTKEPASRLGVARAKLNSWPAMVYLAGYFLFGAGYIAYMTFMIAYVRDAGGGAMAQSAFWSCIAIGAFAQPWVWRGVMARGQSGRSSALVSAVTAFGAALPLFSNSPVLLALSALIFGNAFFAVVSSTTAFARFNYPSELWPQAIAMMTVAFGIGQTVGPVATGAITDAMGSLSYALNVSAAVLVAGAILFACQPALTPPRPAD